MNATNPYSAPQSDVGQTAGLSADEELRLQRMAKGQKFMIYAILAYFFIGAVGRAAPIFSPLIVLCVLAILGLSLTGFFMVLSTRKSHIAIKILLFILMFVPLVNLIVMLRLNSSATKTLRENGYRVGLLGASKRT